MWFYSQLDTKKTRNTYTSEIIEGFDFPFWPSEGGLFHYILLNGIFILFGLCIYRNGFRYVDSGFSLVMPFCLLIRTHEISETLNHCAEVRRNCPRVLSNFI